MCHYEIGVFFVFRMCCFISVLALTQRDFKHEFEWWRAEYIVLGKGWWNLECGENILVQVHWRKWGKKNRHRSQLINHWRNAFWKDSKCYLSNLGLFTRKKDKVSKKEKGKKKGSLAVYTTKEWWLWLKQLDGQKRLYGFYGILDLCITSHPKA